MYCMNILILPSPGYIEISYNVLNGWRRSVVSFYEVAGFKDEIEYCRHVCYGRTTAYPTAISVQYIEQLSGYRLRRGR
jgi:hypothetical protein